MSPDESEKDEHRQPGPGATAQGGPRSEGDQGGTGAPGEKEEEREEQDREGREKAGSGGEREP
jgi:hypothetical protein